MRIDLLYHYVCGQAMGWFNQSILRLNTTDNGIVSVGAMVVKEATDKTGFDLLDLAFGIVGWATQIL